MSNLANYTGEKGRARLIQEHFIRCVCNVPLLECDQKSCCCGQPLKKEGYVFFLTEKNTQKKVETPLLAGSECAQKLADKLKIKLPPRSTLFDETAPKKPVMWKFEPLNEEFYRAIVCICGLLRYIPAPRTRLGKSLEFLARYPERKTDVKFIIEINDRIPGYFDTEMTIGEMYEYQTHLPSSKRPELDFPLLRSLLKEHVEKIFI